jgi:hypothetical protein
VKQRGSAQRAKSRWGYNKLIVDVIRNHRLELRAPALRQGDILFWSAKLSTVGWRPRSRAFREALLVRDYIPSSSRFLQYQTRTRHLTCTICAPPFPTRLCTLSKEAVIARVDNKCASRLISLAAIPPRSISFLWQRLN